jgi:hypothetical protein
MTRDDIINMANQAGLYHFYDSESHCTGITDARLVTEDKERDDDRLVEMLAPFAALVAAAERERIIAKNAPEIEKINAHIQALEEAVAAEREACAKLAEETVCDTHLPTGVKIYGTRAAKAIRERSNP